MRVKQHTRWAAVVVMTAAAVLGLATVTASATAGAPAKPAAVSVFIPGDPPAGLPPQGTQILSVDPVLDPDSGAQVGTADRCRSGDAVGEAGERLGAVRPDRARGRPPASPRALPPRDACVTTDTPGIVVFGACPSRAVHDRFSRTPQFLGAVAAAGLPAPRIEPLCDVHLAYLRERATT